MLTSKISCVNRQRPFIATSRRHWRCAYKTECEHHTKTLKIQSCFSFSALLLPLQKAPENEQTQKHAERAEAYFKKQKVSVSKSYSPDCCHGNKRPPKSFPCTNKKRRRKLSWVLISILKRKKKSLANWIYAQRK